MKDKSQRFFELCLAHKPDVRLSGNVIKQKSKSAESQTYMQLASLSNQIVMTKKSYFI